MSDHQKTLDSWLSRQSHHHQPHTSTPLNPDTTAADSPPPQTRPSRSRLAATAQETKQVLPSILAQLPHIDAHKSQRIFLDTLPALDPADCPRHAKKPIRIVNEDTLNAAIQLAAASSGNQHPSAALTSRRVAVLNMASHSSPGGGWLNGAMAQEEALCYRSSLALSLHRRYYPWKQRMGIYTRDVVVIRSDMPSGHNLLVPTFAASDLPVVSTLSIAALRCPRTTSQQISNPEDPSESREELRYTRHSDRDLMKVKIRLCLRMAASKGHGLLVLGALGCGAFRNPREEVARLWLEVFREEEFRGGWWEEVWFAVYDRRNEGNYEVFEDILGGVEV